MTNELKPVNCGCGGEAKVYRNIFVQNSETHIYVCCEECLTRSSYFPTETEAITAWNRAMGADKVDELMEHIWRKKLDTREKIADLVERMLR